MEYDERDFEIRVQGQRLLHVRDGGLRIEGKDFHADLRALKDMAGILKDVISMAEEAGRLRVVEATEQRPRSVREKRGFPFKIIHNA